MDRVEHLYAFITIVCICIRKVSRVSYLLYAEFSIKFNITFIQLANNTILQLENEFMKIFNKLLVFVWTIFNCHSSNDTTFYLSYFNGQLYTATYIKSSFKHRENSKGYRRCSEPHCWCALKLAGWQGIFHKLRCCEFLGYPCCEKGTSPNYENF